jgi:hypothetical protein
LILIFYHFRPDKSLHLACLPVFGLPAEAKVMTSQSFFEL